MNDFLHFTTRGEPRWSSFDVHEVVREVLESFAPQCAARGIVTEADVPAGTRLVADRELFRRALLQLVVNAMDAMPRGGELDVTCWSGPSGLELEVSDSGAGVDEATQSRMFEPHFTTKPDRQGMGLAVVRRVVEAHGGRVWAANCPQGGAALTLAFPQRAMKAAA